MMICLVCGDTASGCYENAGGPSCASCRVFFRRMAARATHSHLTHSNVRTQLFRQNHGILAKLDHQRYLKPTKVKKNAKLLFYLFLSGNAVAC